MTVCIRIATIVCLAGLLEGSLVGCVEPAHQQTTVAPEVAIAKTRYRKQYVLAAGDQVDIVVLNHPAVSRSCTIRPDGYISLPLLDDVKTAGLTPLELRQVLTDGLAQRLREPEVTVIPTSLRPPAVYVLGEVLKPVVVTLREAPTAADAIGHAGGFTPIAAYRGVVIIRTREDGTCLGMKIETGKLHGQAGPFLALSGVRLEADDIVFVPRSQIGQLGLYLDQYVNKILMTANTILNTYAQVRWIEVLDKQIDAFDTPAPTTQPIR